MRVYLLDSAERVTTGIIPADRDQLQPQVPHPDQQAVQVGQRARKQSLILSQVRQPQACKPFRPALIQMAPDFDLVVFLQSRID